jgi:hypothetical protein
MKKFFTLIILLLPLFLSESCKFQKQLNPKVAGQAYVEITDDSLLSLTEYRTFQYFWDGAEPNSGMARERYHIDGQYPENDMNVVTTGGTGFGVMAILAAIERKFISREAGSGKTAW